MTVGPPCLAAAAILSLPSIYSLCICLILYFDSLWPSAAMTAEMVECLRFSRNVLVRNPGLTYRVDNNFESQRAHLWLLDSGLLDNKKICRLRWPCSITCPRLNEKTGSSITIKMCATGNQSLEDYSFWLYIIVNHRGYCQGSRNEIGGGQWLYIPIWLIKDGSEEGGGVLPMFCLADGGAVMAPAGDIAAKMSLRHLTVSMWLFPLILLYIFSSWQKLTHFKETNLVVVKR